MIEYVKKAFQKYATFTGRANRPEFWWFFLFLVIIQIIVQVLAGMMPVLGIIGAIVYLVMLLPYIAVGIRRMHDVGKSGWFILIPIYNIILFASEGQPGSNEYGPNPNDPAGSGFDFEQQRLQS